MTKILKSESGVSLLITVSLFAVIYLIYIQWQSQQNEQYYFLFQQQQALQIAENQIALKMANMACNRMIKQNNIQFMIQCNDENIIVQFPLGEIKIVKP